MRATVPGTGGAASRCLLLYGPAGARRRRGRAAPYADKSTGISDDDVRGGAIVACWRGVCAPSSLGGGRALVERAREPGVAAPGDIPASADEFYGRSLPGQPLCHALKQLHPSDRRRASAARQSSPPP